MGYFLFSLHLVAGGIANVIAGAPVEMKDGKPVETSAEYFFKPYIVAWFACVSAALFGIILVSVWIPSFENIGVSSLLISSFLGNLAFWYNKSLDLGKRILNGAILSSVIPLASGVLIYFGLI